MAYDNFYTNAASQRLAQIEAQRAQSLANLAQCKANSDYESAALEVQAIANCEAEKANLIATHNQYVDSMTPRQPPELSAEEKAAKPWSRMDASDILDLARTSKYARNIDWNDEGMRAGYQEVLRRRGRGE